MYDKVRALNEHYNLLENSFIVACAVFELEAGPFSAMGGDPPLAPKRCVLEKNFV